jgi:hypothetical protein
MDDNKLNKLKIFLSQEYPKDTCFTKSELNYVDINDYCGTSSYMEVENLFSVLVSENFLTQDYRFGKYVYEINSSKIIEKPKSNLRNKTSKSNEIVARDFEQKKQQLQNFSRKLPKTSNLPIVRGGNHWYGAAVKATGDDLNNLSSRIADSLIEQNKEIVATRKEFINIYDTFEALDKDYIQRILVNIKSTEEANRKAVKGLQQNKNLFDSQKKIIEVLKKHKDDLDNLNHLKDIDDLFNSYTNFEAYQDKNIKELRDRQENIDIKFLEYQKRYSQFSDKQGMEVAKLQNNQEKISNELDKLSGTVINFDEKLEHLDSIFKKLDESSSEKINNMKSTSDESFSEIFKKIEENKNENIVQIKSICSEMENQLNEAKESFQKKLKTTRLFLIISCIAFIVLFVLILCGVIQ